MARLILHHAHPWDLTPGEAARLQASLRDTVILQPLAMDSLRTVCGVDLGFRGEMAHAALVVLRFPTLEITELAEAETPITFPYVPGLLSFRELPAVLAALEKLSELPDVFLCDGQGLAHPRRFGIACHLGVLLDRPAVGCAKSILVGRHAPVDPLAGSFSELRDRGETVGMALRTKTNVKPVFISPGHRCDLPSAVNLALACTRGYRLPEPTRLADRLASRRGPV
jgi:deoxyribonuclease V